MAKSFKDFPAGVQALLLILVAVVLTIGPWYYFVFLSHPTSLFQERTTKQKQLADLKRENEANRAFEQKLADYQAQIQSLEQQLGTMRRIVPDSPLMDEYMKSVYADAGNTSIHVRTFIPKPQMQQKYYVEMPVQIRIDGTYWQMVNFFDRLAKEERIISVTSIDLGTPKGGGMGNYEVTSNETVGANCVVTTYYNQPAPSPAPPGRAPAAPAPRR